MSVVVVETPRHLRYVLSDQHILFRCTLIPSPLLPISHPLSVVSECSVRRSAQASWVPQTLPPSLPRMPLCHPQVSPFFYFPPFLSSFFPAIRLTFSLFILLLLLSFPPLSFFLSYVRTSLPPSLLSVSISHNLRSVADSDDSHPTLQIPSPLRKL